jgi:hypothetical protein
MRGDFAMRLNGWKRIGIIASVVWAIGAFVHYSGKAMDFYQSFANTEVQSCLDANGGKELPDVGCLRRGEDDAVAHLPEAREEGAIYALFPIPFAWGIVYLVIFVVRWVRRGFVSDEPKARIMDDTQENSLGTSEASKA